MITGNMFGTDFLKGGQDERMIEMTQKYSVSEKSNGQ